jgi:HK97 family phage major capsid protein
MSRIAQLRGDHAKLVAEVKEFQALMESRPLTAAEGTAAEAKAQEAEAKWAEIEQAERMERIAAKGREIPDPALPAPRERKEQDFSGNGNIAGYLTLGEATVNSPQYKQFVENGFPRGEFILLAVPELKQGFVPLTHQQRADWEAKAVPTLGTGVLNPQRLADIVRQTQDDATVLRDVLNVSRTTASSVEYVREDSYTRAAAPVAHGAAKPQGALAYSVQSTTVRTLAVWIPATVQMLSDWPALRNLIDNRLLYDLRKEEEEQVMYGDGTGQNFAGIIPNAGHDIAVSDARVTSPTLIDQIMVGSTDVRVSGYTPNAVVMHPIDREKLALQKGTDGHYLYQVFPAADGVDRVWGLRIVQTVATEATAGDATEARNLVVGDFVRGATLWVREEANVIVGMQNDDLTKNLRTILAEERAAFAVTAPDAFAVLETVAAVA